MWFEQAAMAASRRSVSRPRALYFLGSASAGSCSASTTTSRCIQSTSVRASLGKSRHCHRQARKHARQEHRRENFCPSSATRQIPRAEHLCNERVSPGLGAVQ